jgi:hypothetical protein
MLNSNFIGQVGQAGQALIKSMLINDCRIVIPYEIMLRIKIFDFI